MYSCPLRRFCTCSGVKSIEPVTVPLTPLETVRSPTDAPRTPVASPRCRCATVAGERNPVNVPFTVSLVPISTAEAEPDPATASRIPPSIGTVESRTLYRSWLCDAPDRASETTTMATARTATTCLSCIVHLYGPGPTGARSDRAWTPYE